MDIREHSGCEPTDLLERLSTQTKVPIDLPVLVVLGDTSCGKSSVLSQLSGVDLPSAHQITTKCPVRLHLKPHATFVARVAAPDWPTREVAREDIAATILQAQEHLLPDARVTISRQVIDVHVQGPQFTQHLTLVDLPGLVRATAHDESPTLAADVQALLDEHCRNPRALVVAILASNVDFHNAPFLQHKPPLAVLTKPDLVDPGAEPLELLRNTQLPLQHGYHVVKGRGQAALEQQVSIVQGLEDEQEYFESQEPWKSWSNRSQLGTAALRTKLATLQTNMVRQWIPDVLKDLRTKQQAAQTQLAQMGRLHVTTVDRRRYYLDTCQSLVAELQASLSGKGRQGTKPSGAAQLHEACKDFRNSIRQGELATVRKVTEGGHVLVTSARGNVKGEVVHVDEDFCCVDYVDLDDRHSEALFEYVNLLSKEPIDENDVWSDGTKVYIARKENYYDSLKKIPLGLVRTDPSWLKDKIADNRTDDLACFLNVDIFKNIVQDFIAHDWKPHCTQLLERTRELLLTTVRHAAERALVTDRYPQLRSLVERECRAVADRLLQQARQQVDSHLTMEQHPYTQDEILFSNIAQARHGSLKRELEVALRLEQEGVFDTQAIRTIMDGVFDRVEQKSVEDHLAEEMEMVLDSYGQVATRRVVDRTPMICWEVFRSLATSIQESLWSVTDETITQYMQEEAGFAAKYQKLTEELDEMNKALELFESIL